MNTPSQRARQPRVGANRLLRLLARGGMGEVYLARREGPGGFAKLVVLKRIRPELSKDQQFVEMFLNEARLAGALCHPNVVQVFDLCSDPSGYYLTMEYVHGVSLREVLIAARRRGLELPVALSARVCADALRGLHHAHTLGDPAGRPLCIVHRDVSPENILVAFTGKARVTDFGVAKAMALPSAESGLLKGKLHFIAPEVICGVRADARTDVYAMGAVLYRCLAGALPFEGNSEAELLHAVLHRPLRPVQVLAPAIPPSLAAVAQKALARNPGERFQTAEEMADALELAMPSTARDVAHCLVALLGEEAQRSYPGLETPTAVPAEVAPASVAVALEEMVGPQAVTRGGRRPRRSVGALALTAVVLLVAGLSGAQVWARDPAAAPPEPPIAAAPLPEPELEPAPPRVAPIPAAPAPPEGSERGEPRPRRSPLREVRRGRGTVELRVSPWAEVWVNGVASGTTPMPAIELDAGTHQLRLRNPELDVTRTVEVQVRAGRPQVLKVNLFR